MEIFKKEARPEVIDGMIAGIYVGKKFIGTTYLPLMGLVGPETNELARRLIACWNYCRDLSMDELEPTSPAVKRLRGVRHRKKDEEREDLRIVIAESPGIKLNALATLIKRKPGWVVGMFRFDKSLNPSAYRRMISGELTLAEALRLSALPLDAQALEVLRKEQETVQT